MATVKGSGAEETSQEKSTAIAYNDDTSRRRGTEKSPRFVRIRCSFEAFFVKIRLTTFLAYKISAGML